MTSVMKPGISSHNRFCLLPVECGFGDAIKRIDVMLAYCTLNNRTLIIDARGTLYQHLDEYFFLDKKCSFYDKVILSVNGITDRLKGLTVYPKSIKAEDIENYLYYRKLSAYMQQNQGRFSANTDYQEQLLIVPIYFPYKINPNVGKPKKDIKRILRHLIFKPNIAQEIYVTLMKLYPFNYCAIHIRNTDRACIDYKERLEEIRPQVVGKKVLICSDRQECIDWVKETFVDSEVLTTGSKASKDSTRLHLVYNNLEKKPNAERRMVTHLRNIELFTDLCAMSLSTKFYHISYQGRSGYPGLVIQLINMKNMNKPPLGINLDINKFIIEIIKRRVISQWLRSKYFFIRLIFKIHDNRMSIAKRVFWSSIVLNIYFLFWS